MKLRDVTKSIQYKDEQMGLNELVWIACYIAVDFRARFRFLRAAGESPRRLRSCEVSLIPLFPQESSPCLPINR